MARASRQRVPASTDCGGAECGRAVLGERDELLCARACEGTWPPLGPCARCRCETLTLWRIINYRTRFRQCPQDHRRGCAHSLACCRGDSVRPMRTGCAGHTDGHIVQQVAGAEGLVSWQRPNPPCRSSRRRACPLRRTALRRRCIDLGDSNRIGIFAHRGSGYNGPASISTAQSFSAAVTHSRLPFPSAPVRIRPQACRRKSGST